MLTLHLNQKIKIMKSKKFLLTFFLVILINSSFIFSQNRFVFKYKLSQKTINNKGFVLKDQTQNKILYIGHKQKLKCSIKLNSSGKILVDFWQILNKTKKCKREVSDKHRDQIDTINSAMAFDLDKLPILYDNRDSIGKPTKALFVPFTALSFGFLTLPFRLRPSERISPTDNSTITASTPKPDIAISGGYTWGYGVITNRAIINYSLTLGGFVGLTSAEIKNGVVKSSSALFGGTKTQTNAALSYGGTITFARNNFGIVLALGLDNSFGDFSQDWIYQNKPWFGVGISANLGFF